MPPIAILIALADPTRCRIIEILRAGPQPVHVLAGAFDISRPAISRHLRVLKQARLISEKKSGRENRYGLHPHRLQPVLDWLEAMTSSPKLVTVKRAAVAKRAAAPAIAPPAKPPLDRPVSQMGFDF
jgi:DNA-binding transcriptional ArsR family regulator